MRHQVSEATADAYKRLLKPSIETEFAAQSKEKADEEPYACSRKTSASYCLPLHWDRNGCSQLIPDSVPDAK